MTASPVRVLIAHDGDAFGRGIAPQMPAGVGIIVTGVVDDLASASIQLQESDAEVLLVVSGAHPEGALALVRWWVGNRAGRPVVMLCHGSDNGFVGRAFSAGVDELVIVEPDREVSGEVSQQLRFALQKAIARRSRSAEGDGKVGSMTCVLGPKGGTGKTLTSANLGVALAERERKVAVVDLDLQFGDLALALGLMPESTLADLAASRGLLDEDKLDRFLATHESGLRLLMAPMRPDQASTITIELLTEVYAFLRSAYDFVIVDTPPAFTPEVIAAIDASSDVLVVCMLDALSLKNTKLGLETLELMGYDPERTRILLNRADSSVGITQNDVFSILGQAPQVLVPSDRDITRSVNEGVPIVQSRKRSPGAKAFQMLADLYDLPTPGAEKVSKTRARLARSDA